MNDINAEQRDYWTQSAGNIWSNQAEPMDAALAPVLDAVLEAANLRPGAAVLDVGCGAGASTRRAAQHVGASGRVVGADISTTLLDTARTQTNYANNVTFIEADAQIHNFDKNSFDVAISRFGIMFFNDFTAAFKNIRSAIAPRGRIAFSSWGQLDGNPYFTMPAAVSKGLFGPMPKSDPDAPGPLALRDPDRFKNALQDAGFKEVLIEERHLNITPAGTLDDVLDLICEIGPAYRALKHFDASQSQRTALREALAEELKNYNTPDGIRIPALINIATARNPA